MSLKSAVGYDRFACKCCLYGIQVDRYHTISEYLYYYVVHWIVCMKYCSSFVYYVHVCIPCSLCRQSCFPKKEASFELSKDGRLESDVTKHFNAYKRVQNYLYSEIYRTFENNHEITCKLNVCRLPISFDQATTSFVQLHCS